MSVLSLMGTFDENLPPNIIHFTKSYFVSYVISEPQVIPYGESRIIGHGDTGRFIMEGTVTLKSNSFSAQNPINVEVELFPPKDFNGFNPETWNVFPDNYFAYFPKAGLYDPLSGTTSYEKSVIIKLNKISGSYKIAGSEQIIYPHEGEFEYQILDPRELDKLGSLKGDIELQYSLAPSGLSLVQDTEYESKIRIDSSNSIQNILSDRKTNFYYWLAFTLSMPSGIFALGKFAFKVHYLNKNPNKS